jgi:hypothetical protein
VAFALSAMPRLLQRFASAVFPLVNLHGRVDVFVGPFTRPSQAGRFDALRRPRRSSHKMVLCVPRGAWERIEAFGASHPSSLRRATYVALFKVAFLRISFVFSHNPRKIICFTEFVFHALQLEGFKGGHHFGGLPWISPWALVSVAKSCYSDDNELINLF